jgi:hypothetical protein
MAIEPSDIVLVLSGGSINTNTDRSLGGDPAAATISGGINNLFSDVTPAQAAAGRTDYRCFYVFNDNGTDTFKSVVVWIDSQADHGATAQLGVAMQNDLQLMTITGPVVGGSLTMDLDGSSFSFSWNPDLAVWGNNLQTALNALAGVDGAQVSASLFGAVYSFQIVFQGRDSGRFFPLMAVTSMGLTGTGPITVSMTKLVNGAPINSIAPEIDVATTPPPGVTFADSSSEMPIPIGDIRPTEGFPVWVKRVTDPGTQPLANDGFVLGIEGDPIQ